MMVGNTGTDDKSKDSSGKKNKDGQVKVMEMVTNMFSKMNTNDLKSLKKHLEKDNDALKSYTNAVEYDYDVDPQIYREDSDGVRQVHPDKSFSSIGIGADSGANSMMSSMMSTNAVSYTHLEKRSEDRRCRSKKRQKIVLPDFG